MVVQYEYLNMGLCSPNAFPPSQVPENLAKAQDCMYQFLRVSIVVFQELMAQTVGFNSFIIWKQEIQCKYINKGSFFLNIPKESSSPWNPFLHAYQLPSLLLHLWWHLFAFMFFSHSISNRNLCFLSLWYWLMSRSIMISRSIFLLQTT